MRGSLQSAAGTRAVAALTVGTSRITAGRVQRLAVLGLLTVIFVAGSTVATGQQQPPPSRPPEKGRTTSTSRALVRLQAEQSKLGSEVSTLRQEVNDLKTAVTQLEAAIRDAGRFKGLGWSDFINFGSSVLSGFIAGLVSVIVWQWFTRPTVRFLGFERVPVNFGVLYKLRFRLGGRASPGVCGMRLEWPGGDLFAKWDETPNPLERDDPNQFRAELVPLTFYQPLFHGRDYVVPIVVEESGGYALFSGWWFGRRFGYGPGPALRGEEQIRVTISGSGLNWSEAFPVAEIIGRAP